MKVSIPPKENNVRYRLCAYAMKSTLKQIGKDDNASNSPKFKRILSIKEYIGGK